MEQKNQRRYIFERKSVLNIWTILDLKNYHKTYVSLYLIKNLLFLCSWFLKNYLF